jgi:glycosyltransferase involved in cell wall biosynthesis
LHVLDRLHPSSGVSSVVMNYCKNIDKTKYIFDFMVNEPPEEETEKYIHSYGGRIYRMPPLRLKYLFLYLAELRLFYRQHPEYALIHGHIANAAVFYLGVARLYARPARVIHSHNSAAADVPWKQVRNRLLTLPLAFVANRYMACSGAASDFLFGRFPSRPVHILHNAVDTEVFMWNSAERKRLRSSLNIGEEKLIVGHVGRMCPQKNHGFLLRIFAEVLKRRPDSLLWLVGDGDRREALERESESLGVAERVRFWGIRKDVPALMQAMDVLALPSLFEGLPVVAVEAQAAGLPCVLADSVAQETAVTDGCAFLPLGDPSAWAERVLAVAEKARKTPGRETFARFDIARQARVLEEYYDNAMGKSA